MRLKVSLPPLPARPPTVGAEVPAADIALSLCNCLASSSRRLMAIDRFGFGLLGGIHFVLQLREVAALIARHQADILLLERRQPILGRAQALFIVLDLGFEKLLRMFRALALAAQSLLDEGGQQRLDHTQARARG